MVAEQSSLPEYPHVIATGREHLGALAGALAAFGAKIRRTSDLFDQNTADICTEVSRGIDKWLWSVEAHLQERPDAALLKAGATHRRLSLTPGTPRVR